MALSMNKHYQTLLLLELFASYITQHDHGRTPESWWKHPQDCFRAVATAWENEVWVGSKSHSTSVLARKTCFAVPLECIPPGVRDLIIEAPVLLPPPQRDSIWPSLFQKSSSTSSPNMLLSSHNSSLSDINSCNCLFTGLPALFPTPHTHYRQPLVTETACSLSCSQLCAQGLGE